MPDLFTISQPTRTLPFFGNADIFASSHVPDDKVSDEEAKHDNLKVKVANSEFWKGDKEFNFGCKNIEYFT